MQHSGQQVLQGVHVQPSQYAKKTYEMGGLVVVVVHSAGMWALQATAVNCKWACEKCDFETASLPHPHVEGVVVQPVLQPEQSHVCAQCELADAVAVEVKLVLSEICELGRPRGRGCERVHVSIQVGGHSVHS